MQIVGCKERRMKSIRKYVSFINYNQYIICKYIDFYAIYSSKYMNYMLLYTKIEN